MTYRVYLHAQAVKEIEGLEKRVRTLVKAAVSGLSDNPTPVGCAKLKGRINAYRLRVGDYRILYEVHATEIVVYVFGIAHRKEAYLRLLRRP